MKEYKLLLSSSSELKKDLEEFENFIRYNYEKWLHKGMYLTIISFHDFFDTHSGSELQRDFQKAICECDLFVMLFTGRLCAYGKKELKVAFGQFKQSKKPLAYIYCKNHPDNKSSFNEKSFRNLNTLRREFTHAGHFYKTYTNIAEVEQDFDHKLFWLIERDGIMLRKALGAYFGEKNFI